MMFDDVRRRRTTNDVRRQLDAPRGPARWVRRARVLGMGRASGARVRAKGRVVDGHSRRRCKSWASPDRSGTPQRLCLLSAPFSLFRHAGPRAAPRRPPRLRGPSGVNPQTAPMPGSWRAAEAVTTHSTVLEIYSPPRRPLARRSQLSRSLPQLQYAEKFCTPLHLSTVGWSA